MQAMATREAEKPKLEGRIEIDPAVPLRGPEGRLLPRRRAAGRQAGPGRGGQDADRGRGED